MIYLYNLAKRIYIFLQSLLLYNINPDIIDGKQYIFIMPYGGLCNYLRYILSYYDYAKNNNMQLVVSWNKSLECNGYFEDLFLPIQGITIINGHNYIHNKIYNIIGLKLIIFKNYLKKCIYGSYPLEFYNPNINYKLYSPLKLNINLLEEINKFKLTMGAYVSMHIRRTDFTLAINNYTDITTNDEFITYINECLKINSNYNIYLATDNKVTQDYFKTLYGDKLFVYKNIVDSIYLRKTDLKHAIIDIYLCKDAEYFKGTTSYDTPSSFSQMIYAFKHLPV